MAEVIGIVSGLLTLATFAFDASVSLRNRIKSYQYHPKQVRDLLEELEALTAVLGPLQETLSATSKVDLSELELPLKRCGSACREFDEEIKKRVTRTGATLTSFRDWAKIQYMRDDIDGFRRLISGYKSTINVALTGATLRISSQSAGNLESYKRQVMDATEDLEDHLDKINEKLDRIIGQSEKTSESDAAELSLIEEERLSTEKCLQICRQLSEHIDQLQLAAKRDDKSASSADEDSVPERVLNEGLQEAKKSLVLTAMRLEQYMKEVRNKLVTKSKTAMTSNEDIADLLRLQQEWETTQQAMNIFSKAENYLRDNVSVIDNYATGDAVQFMVSTNGKVIHGKNRGLGWRSRQVGGHLSDEALKQISHDMSTIVIQNVGKPDSSPPASGTRSSQDEEENKPSLAVKDHWSQGVKLGGKS